MQDVVDMRDGIDAELVRALLREQHPDLAGRDLRPVAGGWDNLLWRLGDDLAVRMPCTERGPALLRKEFHRLPPLARRLPLPVPVPLRLGEPSARFPRNWTVVRWVPGEPADLAPVARGAHAADALAAFLRALHISAPADAPAGSDRGVPLSAIAPEFAGRPLPARVRDVWEDALAAPAWTGPPVWLHGDLHPANAVVTDGTLSGVIDFGELCAGDPATDLAAAWLLLPAGADRRFFDSYAAADEAMIRRARGWAVRCALALIAIGEAGDKGLPGGKPSWGPAGRSALDRVLASAA
ncbi:phosphotransferase [Allonocardiopsis opalescens]|uniref:Aminoglycoside phosphotransferase (APT) family kinase protein n=1 Tax=Allonocardiopsis opalescens TaxID=1144618 RepID=A0A2T0Q237_9ACTN|nr:phosphotransferase [Allonocardiopsis opalescens]PRX97857.1 aminoglycoside phosphotransferase (APT) family kinase protein [Allonocardiopsis opalescens]